MFSSPQICLFWTLSINGTRLGSTHLQHRKARLWQRKVRCLLPGQRQEEWAAHAWKTQSPWWQHLGWGMQDAWLSSSSSQSRVCVLLISIFHLGKGLSFCRTAQRYALDCSVYLWGGTRTLPSAELVFKLSLLLLFDCFSFVPSFPCFPNH